ncbi:MAG: valine--tRNA ligase [Kiritimatiellia bacterium]|nr:valine--tRNA ligase [Kiritimatiellia bacterium]
MSELEKKYNPVDVENKWYQHWLEKKYFQADPARGGKPYTIVIPPPNVTGILHMGHALNVTIQDILIRWRRMEGFNTLWVPGTDHAGIATQNVVERALRKEGKTRNDLGRAAFVKKVWQWREQYGNTIIQQLKKLGVACDWDRLRSTMDEGLSDAVTEVFIRLYNKNLIYRGNYIINWCPRCHTALSDEESVHVETRGKLYFIRYPLKSDKSKAVVVATTRPETMLGDVAVAVNPTDERYRDLVGQQLILPVMEREIPVIADEFVDPEFGTGAVKVTPAHDPNDFAIGGRHGLEPINVMRADGKMNENAGKYAGQDRFECRRQIVEFLDKAGLIEKIIDHPHAVGHCYRCDTVVEPRLSLQWFIKMKPLARPAIEAVQAGRVVFIPERWTKVYLDWMENIRDWCISRQIWWGHRIPVFYCDECGHEWVSKTTPHECEKCKSGKFRQDEDVLDTWFSSWLWPFSTLDWPKGGDDLKFYYPTDTLVTASEIIFFWVARMIMAGLEFMNEVPFQKVYIHGTVRDNTGRKMSKSLGNSIDPQAIIEGFSADALRFSLMMVTATGQDVFLSDDKFEIGRNFLTKVWNAARFIQMNDKVPPPSSADNEVVPFSGHGLSPDEQFIIARLDETVSACTENLKRCRFNDYAKCIYDFVWHQFCDWHIEYVKLPLNSSDARRRQEALRLLHHVFANILRLLHPLTPFITEELWHGMGYGAENETIQLAPWPKSLGKEKLSQGGISNEAVEYVENKHELIRTCRNLRKDCDIPSSARVRYVIKPENESAAALLAADRESILFLLRAGAFDIEPKNTPKKALNAICPLGTIFIPIEGLVDIAREIKKHNDQLGKLDKELAAVEKKLNNAEFVSKAPPKVVAVQKERKQQIMDQASKVRHVLGLLAEAGSQP